MIRPAAIADAAAIARIQVRAWQTGYRGIVSDDRLDALSVDEVEERWNGLLDPAAERPPFVVVAVEEDQIAGYVVVMSPGRDDDLGADVAELVALNVDPSWWRRGIGEALMQAALDRVPERVRPLGVPRERAGAGASTRATGSSPTARASTSRGTDHDLVRLRRRSTAT